MLLLPAAALHCRWGRGPGAACLSPASAALWRLPN